MRELFATYRKTESGASLVEYTIALIIVTTVIAPGIIALAQNALGLAQVVCATTGSALGDAGGGASTCGAGGAGGSSDYSESGENDASSDSNETPPSEAERDNGDAGDDADQPGNRYGNGNGKGQGGNGKRTR